MTKIHRRFARALKNSNTICYLALSLLSSVLIPLSAQDIYDGYVFFSMALGKDCFLYDNDQKEIHVWKSAYEVAGSAHLLRDSSVVFCGVDPDSKLFAQMVPLAGGRYQIIKWNGDIVWDFKYVSKDYLPHHNMEVLYDPADPEGVPHILLVCAVMAPGAQVMYDKVVEIKPTGKTTGEVVWEWSSWDHRTSNPDDNPELLDENYLPGKGNDWTHINSVSYNAELDQIVLGVKHFSEFMIIDHSTTTLEAKGHTGGKYGKGGDILYRWGNASSYGCTVNDYIEDHHCAVWIPILFPGTNLEVPGGGNILFFHNSTSTAVSVKLPGNGDGIYPRTSGKPFGPDAPEWTCKLKFKASPNEGSAQRLPNGNVFVADWYTGKMQEMDSKGALLWSMTESGSMMGGSNQAHKYAKTYLGSATHVKENKSMLQSILPVRIYSNPTAGTIRILLPDAGKTAYITIVSLNGREVVSREITNSVCVWDTKRQSSGVYLITVKSGRHSYTQYVTVSH